MAVDWKFGSSGVWERRKVGDMATDIGRINAARGGIKAVDFTGKETAWVLSALDSLELAIVEARAKDREKERVRKAEASMNHPDFLRCAADYQDAPYGTRVAKRFGSGWWEKYAVMWADENGVTVSDSHIAAAPRKIVKWGEA